MTAYLSVGSDLQRRVLSPLLENPEGEEEETPKPPTLEEYIPRPGTRGPSRQAFMTEAANDSDGSDQEPKPDQQQVSSDDITLNIAINGGCFLEDVNSDDDDSISDGSLSIPTDDFDTDLEIDDDQWLNPSKTDHDTTGRTKYIKVCNDMGISPVSYFVKNLEQRELKMRFHGLGPLGIKAISIPLETNTNIEILNLQGNGIDATGAKSLCRVLRENLFLTEVVLSENKIGTEGAISLCQFLKGNRNLFKVDLTANEIGDSAGQCFYEVLKGNPILKELVLANNCLEENSAKWLKEALTDNENLEVLDLSWNQFKTRGAICLCQGLQENVGLKRFKLVMAGLGKSGAEAMGVALKQNRTLLELDISFNRIPIEASGAIAAGVRENDTLKTLKIGNNPFESNGAMAILQAIDQNENSAITFLDFSNMMVKIEFAEIETRLAESRGLRVVNEGVLPEMHPKNGNYARLSAFRRDPIETFKKYAEFSGVVLEEVFNCKHKVKIDASEFKTLIKGSGIDIPDQHMTVLIRSLESDGFICYWKIFEENGNNDGTHVSFSGNVDEKGHVMDKNKNRPKSKDSPKLDNSGAKPKSAKAKKKKEKKKKT
ncbi:leucine-rich repeat-containing protein 74B-like [Pecten maximus]|uniref:leucine-rich repeat-containing protein 74B-like n=1 Tax=Pecten maximus TaxID=6579 RepID=UPI0014580293|nr:leucine-rich repeat-containing protein 74B-like [Pecten maximus]XP_033736022.1 leucine-rich repeat-containing protein 74B-like [Pecten maximus]